MVRVARVVGLGGMACDLRCDDAHGLRRDPNDVRSRHVRE
jgi:hypothetical protein